MPFAKRKKFDSILDNFLDRYDFVLSSLFFCSFSFFGTYRPLARKSSWQWKKALTKRKPYQSRKNIEEETTIIGQTNNIHIRTGHFVSIKLCCSIWALEMVGKGVFMCSHFGRFHIVKFHCVTQFYLYTRILGHLFFSFSLHCNSALYFALFIFGQMVRIYIFAYHAMPFDGLISIFSRDYILFYRDEIIICLKF